MLAAPIASLNNNYLATIDGDVLNASTGEPVHKTRAKYLQVAINGTKYVHRLVAEAFVPNPDNKPYVNHMDGDKHNNAASNLEWVNNSENVKHAYNSGLHKGRKSLDEKQHAEVLKLAESGMTQRRIGELMGVSQPTVCLALKRVLNA
jgi:DNA-directed RNA polymerase specialized sigma24 family protein